MKRLQEKEKYGTLTICSSDSGMLAYNVVGIWYLFLLSLIHTKKHRSPQKQTMMPSLIVFIMIQSMPWAGVGVPAQLSWSDLVFTGVLALLTSSRLPQ